MIYLDNAATTKIDDEVLDEMMPYLTNKYGNPSSMYKLGQESKKAIEIARERVARFIHAENADQIVFTSGGTEANNIALLANSYHRWIQVSNIEHDSIQNLAYGYDYFNGFITTDNNGKITSDIFKKELKHNTRLISVMFVNNEIGSINPIENIGRFCRENGIAFHSDCVQAAGCIPIDVNELYLDLASISSHKIYGPKGVGALYIRDPSLVCDLSDAGRFGGEHQEFGVRPGTENVAGIVGFGKACELLTGNELNLNNSIMNIKREFWKSLNYHVDKYGMKGLLHDNAHSSESHGKVLNFRIDGIDAETMILMLSAMDICVSAGSACRSLEQEPSRVLTAIGLTDDQARDSIRVSFSKYNTEEEIKDAAMIIAETAFRLKEYVTKN